MPFFILNINITTFALLLACYTHALPRAKVTYFRPNWHACPERCQDIMISVSVSAENVVVPALGNLSEPALLAKAGTVSWHGDKDGG